MSTAFDRLSLAVHDKRSALVLGLDPRPERMPPEFRDGIAGVERFHERLIDAVLDDIVAVKPQIAFFEQLGQDGLRAWAATCSAARERGLIVIGDVKRGDIGSTAAAYASAHFGWADILTVQAMLGDDAVEPFLEHCADGKGIFVLCATSNPGWRRFQAIEDASGRPVWMHIADAIAEWNERLPAAAVGAVVGATHPEIVASVRRILPRSWLLLPGVGAQGARIADIATAFAPDGSGVAVPVSRGIASCFAPDEPDWEDSVRARARGLADEMRAFVPAFA